MAEPHPPDLPYSEAVNRISPVQPDGNARVGQRTPRNGNTALITAHRNRLLEVSDRRTFGRLKTLQLDREHCGESATSFSSQCTASLCRYG
jgi:hypothetical protein